PDAGGGDVAVRVAGWGATPLTASGDHPWQRFADPSGNEFCVLGRAAATP
ncbi:hypothetical protein I4J48_30190, partial [Pseudonocardia sp. KRD-169]|nr:hypothetical protein [Pseudonocardia abyssalis]